MFRLLGLLCSRLFAGEQAYQALDQTLEQVRLSGLHSFDRCWRSRCRAGRGECLDGCFLTHDGAGLADRSGFFHFDSSGGGVAGLAVEDRFVIVTQALHVKVRGVHMRVGQDQHAYAGAGFGLGQGVALFVEQEGGDRYGYVGTYFGGAVLQGFFFDQAQHGQGQGLDVADGAAAITARADDAAGLTQRRAQTLTGHFQQAEARDATNLYSGAVGFKAFTHAFFDGTLVLGRRHVDKVDDDQAADVAQAQLASDLFGCFQVGLQRSFFDIATLGCAGGVDVDGNQGFSVVDHDGAAGRQFHFALEGGLDLALDLEAVEQRYAVFVQLHLARILRHDLADEAQGFFLDLFAVDQYFTDVLAQVVADGADDDVAFLVDQERGLALFRGALDGFPELQQVVEVPLQFFCAAAKAGGAHDHAHVGRYVQAVQGFAQLVTLFALDAARNAAGTGVVRHQYQIATGQADKGGQGCALVATFFLVDLDNDFLAFF